MREGERESVWFSSRKAGVGGAKVEEGGCAEQGSLRKYRMQRVGRGTRAEDGRRRSAAMLLLQLDEGEQARGVEGAAPCSDTHGWDLGASKWGDACGIEVRERGRRG